VGEKYEFMRIGQIHPLSAKRVRKHGRVPGVKRVANLVVPAFVFIESGVILHVTVVVARKSKMPSGMTSPVKDAVEQFVQIVIGIIRLFFAKNARGIIHLSTSHAHIAGQHLPFRRGPSLIAKSKDGTFLIGAKIVENFSSTSRFVQRREQIC